MGRAGGAVGSTRWGHGRGRRRELRDLRGCATCASRRRRGEGGLPRAAPASVKKLASVACLAGAGRRQCARRSAAVAPRRVQSWLPLAARFGSRRWRGHRWRRFHLFARGFAVSRGALGFGA